jgi:hypothetical protein
MRRVRRLLVSFASVALAATVGLAPAASAQEGCTLLTVAEVEAALGITGTTGQGSGSFCTFSGTGESVYLVVQPGSDLASQRAQYTDATDTTVAGLPALITETGRSIVVELPGQIMGISHYGGKPWAEMVPILTGLLELAVPRAPAGPSPEDVARLTAMLPETIGGLPTTLQSFSGDLLLGFMPQTEAPVLALNEALAAQGKTAADILLVGRETDDSDNQDSVVAVLIKGADASRLLEPLFRAFVSSEAPATFTPVEVAGRPATRIERADQGTLVVMASGDVLLAATVPESELESVFARLP